MNKPSKSNFFHEDTISFLLIFLIFLLPFIDNYSSPLPEDKKFFFIIVVFLAMFIVAIKETFREKILFPEEKTFLFVTLWFFTLLVSAIFSEFKCHSFTEFFLHFSYFVFLYLIIAELKVKILLSLLKYLLFAAILLSIIGILEFFDIELLREQLPPVDTRVQATFSHRLFFAGYLIAVFPYFYTQLLITKKKYLQIMMGCGLAIVISALFLSFSRNSFLSFILSSFFYFTLYLKISKRLDLIRFFKIAAAFFFFLFILTTAFLLLLKFDRIPDMEIFRYLDPYSNSVKERYYLYLCALKMIFAYPLTGTGIGTFPLAFLPFRSFELYSLSQFDFLNVHSELLEIAVENGIISLLVFLLFIFFLFKKSLLIIDRNSRDVNLLFAASLSSVMAILIDNFLNFTLRYPTSAAFFWLGTGLLIKASLTFRQNFWKKPLPVPKVFLPIFLFLASLIAATLSVEKLLSNFFYNASLEHFKKEDRIAGLKFLEKSEKIPPANYSGKLNLALYYKETGQVKESKKLLLEGLRINKNFSSAYFYLSHLYAENQRFEEAVEAGITLFISNPFFEEIPEFWKTAISLNQVDNAFRILEAKFPKNRDNLFIRYNLSKLSLARGMISSAKRYLLLDFETLKPTKFYLYDAILTMLLLKDFNKADSFARILFKMDRNYKDVAQLISGDKR